MAIEHVNITDPELHEPKGASTASDGQIWVANGLGSGGFSNSMRNCHGQMVVTANSVAKSVTAAVDSTLNTNSDYQKLTGVSAPWSSVYQHNTTFSTDKIVVAFSGYYILSFWGALKVATNNNFVGIKYAINDVAPYSTQKLVSQAVSANDIFSLSATSIIGPIAANSSISIYIAASLGGNITFQDGGLMVAYLHA